MYHRNKAIMYQTWSCSPTRSLPKKSSPTLQLPTTNANQTFLYCVRLIAQLNIYLVLYIGQNIKINAEYQGNLLLWHASSMSPCAIGQIRSVQRSIYQTFTQLVCQSQVWFPNDPIFQKSVYYFKTLHQVTWYIWETNVLKVTSTDHVWGDIMLCDQIPDNVAIVSNVSAIPSLHSRNAAPNITLMSWDKALVQLDLVRLTWLFCYSKCTRSGVWQPY